MIILESLIFKTCKKLLLLNLHKGSKHCILHLAENLISFIITTDIYILSSFRVIKENYLVDNYLIFYPIARFLISPHLATRGQESYERLWDLLFFSSVIHKNNHFQKEIFFYSSARLLILLCLAAKGQEGCGRLHDFFFFNYDT